MSERWIMANETQSNAQWVNMANVERVEGYPTDRGCKLHFKSGYTMQAEEQPEHFVPDAVPAKPAAPGLKHYHGA